jgi:hypothetical protein
VLSYWYCVGDDCHVGRHDVIGLGSIDHRCSPSGHAVHTSASVIEVATLLEIETRLFDRLRGRPYYSRLKGVMIEPSQFLPRDGPRRSLANSLSRSTRKLRVSSATFRSRCRWAKLTVMSAIPARKEPPDIRGVRSTDLLS